MPAEALASLTRPAALLFLLACAADEQPLPVAPVADRTVLLSEGGAHDPFGWSDPVWLGPVINSPARDWRPVESDDGLSLYFHSNRLGFGDFDIWVSRRVARRCPWQTAVNLGPIINTSLGDGDPAFTPGGRTMFFASAGHGSAGEADIFVSRRADAGDDLAWEVPVNLGPDINTAAHEANPFYVANEQGGTLYFERTTGTRGETSDIFRVRLSHRGVQRGPVELVSELSAPAPTGPHAPTIRADGRELIFWSGGAAGTRPGSVGISDLWVSTRRSVNDPWSTPQNLGTPVNSTAAELSATLSRDGRRLYMTISQQRGGVGLQDLWMSTRGGGSSTEAEGPDAHEPARLAFPAPRFGTAPQRATASGTRIADDACGSR